MKYNIKEIEKKVQDRVKAALSIYDISDSVRKELDVGFSKEVDHFTWILYLPREKPSKAIDLAEARFDLKTQEINVKIFENEFLSLKD